MELYENSLKEIRDKIKNKEVKIIDVVNNIFERISEKESTINAFISLNKEYALKRAKELQEKLDNGEDIGLLGGVPIAIKDNISMKNTKTTCASKMLENYTAIYDATVVKKLENAGAIIIGKTNMDEFAMGSSTESSYFKKTKNPYNIEYVPGGSSGGSSAALSSCMCFASLGSDTGGSIRQPASYCNNVGLKPTYGLVSRFGLVAFASSLDVIGPFTKTVEDSALMLNVIKGDDEYDATSVKIDEDDYTKYLDNNVKDVTIGVPYNFIKDVNPEVKRCFEDSINKLKELGAKIVDVDLSYAKYALSVYYILATAEASSNLGRYDGIKYGFRANDFENLDDIYKKSRSEGFGEEVKRRILLGTYVLSTGYFDAYYKKAAKVRTLIINEFKNIFKNVDAICLPTAPNTAFKFGEKTKNPVEMYLEDIFTVPVNIAGIPGISIPCGFSNKNNMPVGMQIISKEFNEKMLFKIAYAFEQNTDFHKTRPNI